SALFRLAPHATPELLDDEPYQVEAEAGALGLHGQDVVRSVELLEEPSLGLLGNPDAVVLDLPAHAIAHAADPYGDLPGARRVLDRVRGEVQDDLSQELRIGDDRRPTVGPRQPDPMFLLADQARHLFEDARGERAEVGRLRPYLEPPTLQAGDVEE